MSRNALVMAGGSSERMRAAGCLTHKALREICDAPLIEHNLRQLFSSGFRRVSVAVNVDEAGLLNWLDDRGQHLASANRADLRVLVEDKPLGTVGAAGHLAGLVDDVLIVNVDNLTDLDLNALYDFHLRHNAALTIASHFEPFRIPFGQLETEGFHVLAYREKPSFPVLVSSGTYVLGRAALRHLTPVVRTQVPDLVNQLIQQGEKIVAFEHSAWWIDINDEDALRSAESALLARSATGTVFSGSSSLFL